MAYSLLLNLRGLVSYGTKKGEKDTDFLYHVLLNSMYVDWIMTVIKEIGTNTMFLMQCPAILNMLEK